MNPDNPKYEPSPEDEEKENHLKKKGKKAKNFGLKSTVTLFNKPFVNIQWYETKKKRDQALESILKNKNHGFSFGSKYTYEVIDKIK